jgi:hypothetical protein
MKAISVFFFSFILALNVLAKPVAPKTNANSGDFSIEELRAQSLARNFDNKIEYEKVTESRKSAEAAYLALAPRLTLNTVATVLSGGGVGLLSAAGDLVPFLFPTNWLQADASEIQSEVEHKTLRIMRENTAVQVESLANLILRDEAILNHSKDLIYEVQDLRQEIYMREALGQYPAGSTANMDAILTNLKEDYLTLQNNQKDQYVQLASMAGYRDLGKIHHVHWRAESYDISRPWNPSQSDLIKKALTRSLEISQAESMIDLASTNEDKSFWSWLDPSGNYLTGLGFYWSKNIEIAKEQSKEMNLLREKLVVTTERDVRHSFILFRDALDHYKLSLEQLTVQEFRKKNLTERVHLGAKVDFFGLVQVLQDYLQSQSQVENQIAQYRNTRGQLKRYTLEKN